MCLPMMYGSRSAQVVFSTVSATAIQTVSILAAGSMMKPENEAYALKTIRPNQINANDPI